MAFAVHFHHHLYFYLGSILIDHIMEIAKRTTNPMVTSLYLHVQTINQKAIRFYMRNGFRIQSIVPNYYKLVENRDAYILARPVFHAGEIPSYSF